MTNGQNVARSRHLEELARAAKRYTLREILDVTEAVATELGGLSIASYDDFTGATSVTGGLSGFVPAPKAGDNGKFLRGDGTWATIESGSSGGTVLDTVPSTVDGALWYEVTDNIPALWVRYGNYDYGYTGFNRQRFTGTADEHLVAYLPFDISPTFDACGNKWTATGNVSLDTTIKKFDSASVHLPSGAYLQANNVISLNADKWTFDCWCYAVNRTAGGVFCLGSLASKKGITVEGESISVADATGTAWAYVTYRSTPAQLNQWTHLAVVRNGGDLYFFEDGQLIWHVENVGTIFDNAITAIGADSWSSDMNLYIDNVRFFDGVALWTENFTPPTAADYL